MIRWYRYHSHIPRDKSLKRGYYKILTKMLVIIKKWQEIEFLPRVNGTWIMTNLYHGICDSLIKPREDS